jgi:hypothetical protein
MGARLTLHKIGPITVAAERFKRRPIGRRFADEIAGHLEQLNSVRARVYAAQTRRFRLTGILDEY